MALTRGHGWWPYLLPLGSFLILGEIAGKFPEAWRAGFLPFKVAVPAGLFLCYWRAGHYPELRTGYLRRPGQVALDFGVGLAGAALWMAPFILALRFDPPLWIVMPEFMRPDPADGFDPAQLGAGLAGLTLTIRCLGYGVVTPFVEELFIRSWLTRYTVVFDGTGDFRDIPIGHYTRSSLVIVTVFFTVSHVPWEWPVAVPWIVLSQLWYYHRKSLPALVTVHAGSNLGIFAFVLATTGRIPGPNGPLDLWFFI
jgi:CAAX prenyl protease-like protein